MAIYEVSDNGFNKLVETSFGAERIFERRDLQRLLRANIEILSPDLLVIAEEFGDWSDSSRRIDLLCLDKEACLVVVEIKRTEDGGHMELQAIRYAAMISTMTFTQLIEAYSKLASCSSQEAESSILSFLDWEEPNEEAFAREVKIILASADFSRELTTSVIWLNQYSLDFRCVRMKPYRTQDGKLLVDVQQIIPLPEASDYQTRIRAKEQQERQYRAERHELRFKFWTGLLALAKTRTALHAQRSPAIRNYISSSAGKQGFSYAYTVRENEAQVELYLDLGVGQEERNLQNFQTLFNKKEEIEAVFGDSLDWQELPESRACRIRYLITGGYRSPVEDWAGIHDRLIDAMIRFDKALKPQLLALNI